MNLFEKFSKYICFYILSIVGPLIQRRHTNYRKCIRAHDRLAITLAYLTTGSPFKVIRNSYFVSKSSISKIITETCAAIIHCFQDELMESPNTKQQWRAIAEV